jgi:SAM-dependent methyltransferase
MMNSFTCLICGNNQTELIFGWEHAPANIGILWSSREAACNCSRGDLKIAFCHSCGYIWNTVFDPGRLEYSEAYDNNLHYSAVYDQYARTMAQHLVERYDLRKKTVLEIGCGKGDFLISLCTLGDNQGIGFDASYETRHLDARIAERISIIRDFYDEKYSDYSGDLVVSRYVLEHIPDPIRFLKMIRHNIGHNRETAVYFEVPDVYLVLEQQSIWDFIYEHISYFSPGSLAFAFKSSGFRVQSLTETFGGQFVAIEAFPDHGHSKHSYENRSDLARLERSVSDFERRAEEKKRTWLDLLEKIGRDKRRALAWGAGAKGVSYLNMLNIRDEIPYIVDINPNKHGKYVPGTGQEIVPPDFACTYRPELVVVMNPVYLDEIRKDLELMGVDAQVLIA